MKSWILQIIILLLKSLVCQSIEIHKLFEEINAERLKYDSIAAEIAWESSINPGNPELSRKAARYQENLLMWQHETCALLLKLQQSQLLNSTQLRQTYLQCRGPRFTFNEARETSSLYEELESIYSDAQICLPSKEIIIKNNLTEVENAILKYLSYTTKYVDSDAVMLAAKIAVYENLKEGLCLVGEKDFDDMMSFSKNERVLKWLWVSWREKVGPTMKRPYEKLMRVENKAARRNGYKDIGAAWRDELEIPNLRSLCHQLYEDVKPLYTLLHGVVRFYLRRRYGTVVPRSGPIPAHLLGNLWSQNWESLADLIVKEDLNLDSGIKKLNWTVIHMVKRAEDFYQSMGLPPMTDTFWRKSIFSRERNSTRCHGAAADMLRDGDYRLLYCSRTSFYDFYVLHHEIGHIQYYMAYANQPGIFRQGTNSAFHEAIGDTIMYGVQAPQHLHRLGLINDSVLYAFNTDLPSSQNDVYPVKTTNNERKANLKDFAKFDADERNNVNEIDDERDFEFSTNEILLLKQALNKLPQIPFALLIDEYRWKYFEGSLQKDSLNKEFWNMALELQGIFPPEERGEEYFDIGAKFHVPDNTPYVRYFLSSFLQHQLFESLCKTAVFGRRDVIEPLPDTITMHRCDIYGSKAAGKLLRDLMSRGSSEPWHVILPATTGDKDITASALKRYYRPLQTFLLRLVRKYRIPIGW